MPSIQPSASQPPQQPAQPAPQANVQSPHSLSGQVGSQEQSQAQAPIRKQQQNLPAIAISSTPVPPVNIQSQPMPSHPLQPPQKPKGHLNPSMTSVPLPQSSQVQHVPPIPLHSASQPPPLHQTQLPPSSTQLQQPLPASGIPHLPLQPPLPLQPRPPPTYHHQYAPQMGPNMGFQHPGGPQHLSQPMFHVSGKYAFSGLSYVSLVLGITYFKC